MIGPSTSGALALLTLLYTGGVAAQGPNATEQEIRKLLDESAVSWNRGDLDGHLADNADSISFMTGKGPIVGKHRTAEALRRSFFRDGTPIQRLRFEQVTIRRLGDGFALVVGRFSVVAGASVVAAGATGTLLAWSQVGSVPALWETAYGRAVMIKVACVGLVAATGAYNHLFLVPAVERDDDAVVAWHRLRRTAPAEA